MLVGMTLRSMGIQSTAPLMTACAQRAEAAGLDSLWVVDHIAIPPDDAEGSNGRYLDPLATLAWLAGQTTRIRLGVGVLILPYRTALPTAKAIATVQELSGGRLELGVGVGWMEPEFRALGVDRRQRGKQTDAVLGFLHECFAAPGDIVVANEQPFLFRPNPPRPPIYVGGSRHNALARVARFGYAWLPMGSTPEKLRVAAEQYRQIRADIPDGHGPAELASVVMTSLQSDPQLALDQALGFAEAGAQQLVVSIRYDTEAQYAAGVVAAGELREAVNAQLG